MIDWLISIIPWQAWIGAVVLAVGAAWLTLGRTGAVAVGGALLALLTFGKVRTDAIAGERAKQDRERLKAIKARKEINDDIAQVGHADLDTRLKQWLRDHP